MTRPIAVEAPLAYIETTIPVGMTISDYRRSRPQPTRWERLKRLAGGTR